MKLGILYDRIRRDEKLIIDAAEKQGAEVVLFDANTLVLPLEKNILDCDVLLERCINHARAMYTLQIAEAFGIPCINSARTAEICGSKFLVTEALLAHKVPTPQTAIAFTREKALEGVERMGYPVVLKPAVGSWGTLLAKVNDREAAEAVIDHKSILGSYHHSVFYLQKYIQKPNRDIRAFVIGNKVVGAVYRLCNHWITHLEKGATLKPCPLTPELEKIACAAARAVEGDIVAVDIVEHRDGFLVIEVEYTVEFSQFFPILTPEFPEKIIKYIMEKHITEKHIMEKHAS